MSDGTTVGTRLLVDVKPGEEDSSPRDFAVEEGRLYFAADDGLHGEELWALDVQDLEMVKTASAVGNPPPGADLVYSLVFSNTGLCTVQWVTVIDELPAELENVQVSSTRPIILVGAYPRIWEVGHLAPGEQEAITITGIISPSLEPGHVFTNTAWVEGDSLEPNWDNNVEVVSVEVGKYKVYLPVVLRTR